MIKPQCEHVCARNYGWISLGCGVFTAALMLCVGVLAGSQALFADGFFSLCQAASGFLAVVSLKIAKRPKDEKHPYGYGKVEFLAAALLSIVLLAVSSVMIAKAIYTIATGNIRPPSFIAVGPAVVSILVNVAVSQFGACVGRQTKSPMILASARNWIDALASLACLAGVVGALIGYPFADPLAAILVAVVNAWIGIGIFRNANRGLLDGAVGESFRNEIRRHIRPLAGVQRIDFVKTRHIGRKIWVDVGIAVPLDMTLDEGEEVAREVRGALLRRFERIDDAVVFLECAPIQLPQPEGFLRRILRLFHVKKAANS